MKIQAVSPEFQPDVDLHYPKHQVGKLIEEYAFDWFQKNEVKTDLIYLPVFWTKYYVTNNYGSGNSRARLHRYLDRHMNPKKKYWTICQYDDGIMLNCSNLISFNCGAPGGITIPLLCDPHPVFNSEKKYIASFVGRLKTHPCRETMAKVFDGDDFCIIDADADTGTFERIMSQSHFAFCPRGYGLTSFRLYEAIQMRVAPIYISDRFLLPFWSDMTGHMLKSNIETMDLLKDLLCDHFRAIDISKEIIENNKRMYDKYFTMNGVCEWIRENLQSL